MTKTFCLLLVMLAPVAPPAFGQTTPANPIMPGEIRENLRASAHTHESKVRFGFGDAAVAYEHVSPGSTSEFQNIRVTAFAGHTWGGSDVRAVGRLVYDFCVPRTGMTTCDDVPLTSAPNIMVNVNFMYGYSGYVTAFGPGAKATLQVTGSIEDSITKKLLQLVELVNSSASLGNLKLIKGIPVPIPDFDVSTPRTAPVTFAALVKRGKKYRFQLSAGASAFAGSLPGQATSDFYGGGLEILPDFFVQLRALRIQVADDPAGSLQLTVDSLEETVESLQEQIGGFPEQIVALTESTQESIASLESAINSIPEGAEGPPGPQGPAGADGAPGANGAAGATGPPGPTGATGPQGETGATGAVGPLGPIGPVGPMGPIGPMGLTGAVGPVGPKGEGLIPGSILMLPADLDPPGGYEFVGRFELLPYDGPRGRTYGMAVDVYKRLAQ